MANTQIKTIRLPSGVVLENCEWYGACTTAATTQAKTVSITGFNSDALYEGVRVVVRFTNAQTYNGEPTLNVSNTGAKAIKIGTSASERYEWKAGAILSFIYYNNTWVMENADHASMTSYGRVKLNASTVSESQTEAATASAVKVAYDTAVDAYNLANGKYTLPTGGIPAGDIASGVIPDSTSDLVNDSKFLHGNTKGLFYGTSTTAAATATKDVTCADFTSSDRVAGAVVFVMIGHTNSAAVADLALNVNGTGARNIKYINNGSLVDLPSAGHLKTGYIYPFYFDGDYWVCMYNYNTTYSGMSDAEIAAGTGTSDRLITPARLKTAVQTWEHVNSVNGQTGAVSLTIPTVPTDVSAFNNDAGYLTISTLPIYGGGVG